ncbi:hypothetical protein KGF42_03515 [Clostridioides sp. ZZV15-6383]|uniref:DUF6973 domain-containing protein n=1 Tax=Clostridioides sp. ZZV15-6383 TaxID=2811498 RepID=UPI001D0FA9E8|nr:hypothetical protein [Clostridioides sp. ZZV15-6383]
MKKVIVTILSVACLTGFTNINSYALEDVDNTQLIEIFEYEDNNINKEDLLSDSVADVLTPEDFVEVYDKVFSDIDLDNISEEALDALVVTELNYIAAQKSNTSRLPVSQTNLNAEEKRLLKKYPAQATINFNDATTATSWAKDKYKDGNADGTNANAYKHSFWNGLLTLHMGESKAKMWADAHEYGKPSGDIPTKMDYQNNNTGRKTCLELKASKGRNPYAFEISDSLLSKISKGQLVRVVNNKLVKTDSSGRK